MITHTHAHTHWEIWMAPCACRSTFLLCAKFLVPVSCFLSHSKHTKASYWQRTEGLKNILLVRTTLAFGKSRLSHENSLVSPTACQNWSKSNKNTTAIGLKDAPPDAEDPSNKANKHPGLGTCERKADDLTRPLWTDKDFVNGRISPGRTHFWCSDYVAHSMQVHERLLNQNHVALLSTHSIHKYWRSLQMVIDRSISVSFLHPIN